MRKGNKEIIALSLEPGTVAKLDRYARLNHLSRSQMADKVIREWVTVPFDREKEPVGVSMRNVE